MPYRLIEVTETGTAKAWVECPCTLYRDDPNWVRPIDAEIAGLFNPSVNLRFEHGSAIRWILQDEKGNTVGRTAAFEDEDSRKTNPPAGGMGFFECIDDKEAAFMLFDAAKGWLQSKGMEAMDGPINFGEKNQFWGLLVDGFTPPIYGMNYHHRYYRKFFEDYGFRVYYNQYSYLLDAKKPLPDRVYKIADYLTKRGGYSFEHFDRRRLPKFVKAFMEIYNKAWANFDHFKPAEENKVLEMMNKLKPVMDEHVMWFAFKGEEPAGFFIMLPDINRIFRHLGGKLDLIGKLKFLWYRWKGVRKIFSLVTGIVPEHQNKGVDAAIVVAAARHIQPLKKYDELELAWIGDFNPKMMSMNEAVGAKLYKTHITYRKLFDPNRPFERAPVLQ